VLFVAFGTNSSLLISGGVNHTDYDIGHEEGSIKVWEAPTWQNRLSISFENGDGGWVHGSLSPRKPYVAALTGASDTAIWNYETGKQLFLLKGHYATVYSTLFSPDGHYLAGSSQDGSIRIWNVQTGTCVRHIIRRKDCEGACFIDVKGLDVRACEWLRDRGATI
jgi:WD40 repeat protein